MGDMNIKEIVLDKEASGEALTDHILGRLPNLPICRVEEKESKKTSERDSMGKETLHLLSYKGEFLKPCPGTRKYICCGYQILNVGTNCPLDCSYCILQSYFKQPFLKTFVNLEKGVTQVLKTIDSRPDEIFRVGTGEFTDSLAIDPVTGWSELLLPLFSKRKNAVLELKTKTDHIQGLLSSKFRDRIIVSWSLNSPFIASLEEHRAVSLKKRLEAARECQSEGFVLGFHFDPLIPHPKWKDEYERTLEFMDKYIDPGGIIWISLGSFRFMPGLKTIIRKRHPATRVLDGEFIPGLDGKMRYFKPIRTELYGFMRERLEGLFPDSGLYLCMESDDVWRKSMGWSPEDSDGLRRFLDRRVVEIFG